MSSLTTIAEIGKHEGQSVTLRGWLYNLRASGKLLFPQFRDGSGAIQGGEVFPNGEPLYDIIRHQAAHYGSLIRCKYGEPFFTSETVRVDDIMSLEVSSF